MPLSFLARRLNQQTMSVKRAPVAANGQIGNAALVFADLPCGQVDPYDNAEVIKRLGLDTATVYKQVMLFGDYQILNGDILFISNKNYTVRNVGDWDGAPAIGEKTSHLILEEYKR